VRFGLATLLLEDCSLTSKIALRLFFPSRLRLLVLRTHLHLIPMTDDVAAGEAVRQRAEACQKIVDEALENNWGTEEFLNSLKKAGATPGEAADYGQQFLEQRKQGLSSSPTQASDLEAGGRESTPEGLSEEQQAAFRVTRTAELAEATARASQARRDAVDAAAWKVLEAKLRKDEGDKGQSRIGKDFGAQLTELLGESEPSAPSGFPASVLDAAPHLKELGSRAFDDPHLGRTWRLRRAYGKEVDGVVDGMRAQDLAQPLARSIWKSIVEDRYVDFEKLFATMDPGYDPNDDAKDFAAGFALIKKESVSVKRSVHTESEWNRIFTTWKDGVTLLYPHRDSELQGYLRIVSDVFRAAPWDPHAAINFDAEVRKCYEQSPYRLDNRNQVQLPLLTQMFQAGAHASTSKRGSGPPSTSSAPTKRSATICNNWNLGFCEDPCSNRRKHGTCSECGGQHRAKDVDSCFAALHTQRGKGVRGGHAESGGRSSGRA